MDNDTTRVAICLRLGSPICRLHQCAHCGANINSQTTHSLNCRWSEGRHHRHASINDILYHSLVAARVPSRLEPSGIYRLDGECPDGVTLVPWKSGKMMVWDATCPDSLPPPMPPLAPGRQEQWQSRLRQNKLSKYAHSTLPICLCLWPWIPSERLAQGHKSS